MVSSLYCGVCIRVRLRKIEKKNNFKAEDGMGGSGRGDVMYYVGQAKVHCTYHLGRLEDQRGGRVPTTA